MSPLSPGRTVLAVLGALATIAYFLLFTKCGLVLTSPQDAFLTDTSHIQAEYIRLGEEHAALIDASRLTVNLDMPYAFIKAIGEEEISLRDFINEFMNKSQWVVRLDRPYAFLRGAGEVTVALRNFIGDALWFDLNSSELEEGTVNMGADEQVVDILFSKGDITYLRKWPGSGFTCGNADLPIVHPLNGTLHIEEFRQGLKRLVLKGTLNVKPSLLYPSYECVDGKVVKKPGDPIEIEIRNLRFAIDSPVVYEWSSKGGKTCRL